MKLFFGLLLCSLASTVSLADQVSVKYSDLLGKQETINIRGVEFKGVVKGQAAFESNRTTIKLHIRGNSACGSHFLVERLDGVTSFFQLGSLGPHIQPGCEETFEYFWTPQDYDMKNEETKIFTLKIGPRADWEDGEKKVSYYTVSAKVTSKKTDTNWDFEYSEIRVSEPQ